MLESLLVRSNDERSRFTACAKAWRPTTTGLRHLSSRSQGRFSDGARARDDGCSLGCCATKGRPNHRHIIPGRQGRAPARSRCVRLRRRPDRELPLILALMPILHACRERCDVRRNLDDGAMAPAPIGSRPSDPAPRHLRCVTRLLGRDLPLTGAFGIRRNQARYYREANGSSRPQRSSTIFVSRPSRCAGTTVTILPPPQRRGVRETARISCRSPRISGVQSRRPFFPISGCVRLSHCCSISSGSIGITFRPLYALSGLLRRIRTIRLAARPTSASASC